jgi:hypothetical protein
MTKKTEKLSEATSALVVQDAKDIKIRLSRGDIFDLCLHEAKAGLEKAFEIERQRCINLRDEVLGITKSIETEVADIMKKRFAKMIRAFSDGDDKPVPRVEVSYATASHIVSFSSVSSRKPMQEKRPSFMNGFRARRSRVEYAKLELGNLDRRHGAQFVAYVSAAELGEIEAVGMLEAVVVELEAACDRLDYLREEVTAFEKRSQHAKQSLMKKILESSDKGRGILDLARSLAKEIDLVAPSAKPPMASGALEEEARDD